MQPTCAPITFNTSEPVPIAASHPGDTAGLLLGLLSLSLREQGGDRHSEGSSSREVIGRETLKVLLSAMHFRDEAIVRHVRQTAFLSVGMAEALQWDDAHVRCIEVAALLHDIGKIGVPDNILGKPGKLSPDEVDLMALHQRIGVDVLQACRVDNEVIQIVSQSQEHYGIATSGVNRIGSEAHQGARILAVADAYDSLTSPQVYRDALSHEKAFSILQKDAGSRFDGNVIQALGRWLNLYGDAYQERVEQLRIEVPQSRLSSVEEVIEASTLGNIFSYLHLLESLYDGFYIVDIDRRFSVWNLSVEELLQRPSADVLGKVWTTDLIPHADQFGEKQLSNEECPLANAFRTHRAQTDMVQIATSDGSWLPMELQTVPLVDRQGNLHGAAQIFRNLSKQNSRTQSYRDLKLAASRDPLTQVANRGQLETHLMKLISDFQQRTDPEPFSVIFIDADHFKSINDTYGHDTGDEVLIGLARLIQSETYSGELVGRFGGEEFIVLCPDTDLDAGIRRADRLRLTLKESTLCENEDIKVTGSFGVASMEPGDSMASLMRRADRGVYLSKENGRNRTTGLTVQDFDRDTKKQEPSKEKTNPYVVSSTLEAFLAESMIAVKLGGFVEEVKGRLGETTKEHVEIRIGKPGLFRRWGRAEESKGVNVRIDIIKPGRGDRPSARGFKLKVKIQITPYGKPKDPADFQDRARRVLRILKGYFQT